MEIHRSRRELFLERQLMLLQLFDADKHARKRQTNEEKNYKRWR
jgi:hypothetical protein